MKKIDTKIVIGSNYGDEGKGLATRYFVKKAIEKGGSCLNVLFNGGPQRGHTAETTNGRKITRHVCHHIGAGLFDGAATFFDEDYMVNPMFFIHELQELSNNYPHANYGEATFYVSPKCRVITPYDSFINQIIELARSNKHGSCGHGIWETQQRYIINSNAWKYDDYKNASDKETLGYLKHIAQDYLPSRLKYAYGITIIPDAYRELIESDGLMQHYLSDLRRMQDIVAENQFDDIARSYDNIVFEGAQGLALDEDNVKAYPHVTASKTGSIIPVRRMVPYCSDIEICYVTRSYFTRHGAGPFPTECRKEEINDSIVDITNASNEFQGTIRYGKFGVAEFYDRVFNDFDLSYLVTGDKLRKSLFITHLNYTYDLCGDSNIKKIKQWFDATYCSRTRFAEDVVKI